MQVSDLVNFVASIVPVSGGHPVCPVQGQRMQDQPDKVIAVFVRPRPNGLKFEGAFQDWDFTIDSRDMTDTGAEATLTTMHQTILQSYQSSFSMTTSSPAIWIVRILVDSEPEYTGIDVDRRSIYRASYCALAPTGA